MKQSPLTKRVLNAIEGAKIQEFIVQNFIEISIFNPIKKLNNQTKEQIIVDIMELTQTDPSIWITGIYSIRNLENRLENVFIKIQHKDTLVILNVRDSWHQVIIIGNDLSSECRYLLKRILKDTGDMFIFAGGIEIVSFIKNTIDYDRMTENIVFELKNEFKISEQSNYSLKWYIPKEKQDAKKETMELWRYDEDRLDGLEGPHVVATSNGETLGGARTNAIYDTNAVIGGVITLKKHRRKGVGYLVSAALTEELQRRGNRVFLETDDQNFPAIKIYERIGYQRIGTSAFFDIGTNNIAEILGDRDY